MMKIIKLKKIVKSSKPIVRVWYKNFWGSLKVRDVVFHYGDNYRYWRWFDNGNDIPTYINHSIQAFYLSKSDTYEAEIQYDI